MGKVAEYFHPEQYGIPECVDKIGRIQTHEVAMAVNNLAKEMKTVKALLLAKTRMSQNSEMLFKSTRAQDIIDQLYTDMAEYDRFMDGRS